ncbi:uncharacterized protein LOC119076667 [Bradysia coprophila]|uniref:uncharacterized protein LOC119076667 n=1 Tax=Bradysia coprophila TaxID=38358 RepID=UPI00187DD260|nr:uncharacterized protein LOC119076667 [Bradysia coprophila]
MKMKVTSGQGSDSAVDSVVQETEPEPGNGSIRRPAVIMQLDVCNQNIETFLENLKKRIEKRTKITERMLQTHSTNTPIKFKSKTWEWTSTSPCLSYQKYHPNDDKTTTTQHLVVLYYRMGPTETAEVFLVSNSAVSLQRFARNANTAFPTNITRRLVDCEMVSKDSSHHLIGNIFTKTRVLRNKTTIDFNDVPVLLLGFTASLRKHCSIFTLSPFHISTKEHRVHVKKLSISFTTPLTQNEEVCVLDHLTKIIRNEETHLSTGHNVIEEDVDLALDITEVPDSVTIQLNNQLAISIHQSIMLSTKLELTLHFPTAFIARCEIRLASKTLYSNDGIPTVSEVLKAISSSGRFNTKKTMNPAALWKTLKSFRIYLLNYNGERQISERISIVDVMHGALHHNDKTYWRFCSHWYQVSSDRLAIIQRKFRQLLKNNLMSEVDSAYLFKKFPVTSTPTLNESDTSSSSQPSTSSAAANTQDYSQLTLSQQSGRDNLEQEYNCKYASEANYLVGDKITANFIEIFDLLSYDSVNAKVYIYHVKRKFGQSTRDAASQLTASAKLIYDDIVGSGEKTLHKHYTHLVEKSDINAKLVEWGITSKEQYVDLYRKNKLTFVYAFVDEDNKSTKRSLKEESQIKETVAVADLITKLELYKGHINDYTNFKSIMNALNRLVFQLPDSIELDIVARRLFEFLVKAKLIQANGDVTSKLLFGINFNQMGLLNTSMQQFHEFTNKFCTKINFFELILRPYRSLYQTLIAKIELQRIYRFIAEKGFEFQICEMERENQAPETPVNKVPIKRDCSGSSSSKKRQKLGGSSSKKKEVPKGQPLITESLRKAARNLSQDLESE